MPLNVKLWVSANFPKNRNLLWFILRLGGISRSRIFLRNFFFCLMEKLIGEKSMRPLVWVVLRVKNESVHSGKRRVLRDEKSRTVVSCWQTISWLHNWRRFGSLSRFSKDKTLTTLPLNGPAYLRVKRVKFWATLWRCHFINLYLCVWQQSLKNWFLKSCNHCKNFRRIIFPEDIRFHLENRKMCLPSPPPPKNIFYKYFRTDSMVNTVVWFEPTFNNLLCRTIDHCAKFLECPIFIVGPGLLIKSYCT